MLVHAEVVGSAVGVDNVPHRLPLLIPPANSIRIFTTTYKYVHIWQSFYFYINCTSLNFSSLQLNNIVTSVILGTFTIFQSILFRNSLQSTLLKALRRFCGLKDHILTFRTTHGIIYQWTAHIKCRRHLRQLQVLTSLPILNFLTTGHSRSLNTRLLLWPFGAACMLPGVLGILHIAHIPSFACTIVAIIIFHFIKLYLTCSRNTTTTSPRQFPTLTIPTTNNTNHHHHLQKSIHP